MTADEARDAGVAWADGEADAVVDWSTVSSTWRGCAIDALPLIDHEDEEVRRELAEIANGHAARRWASLYATHNDAAKTPWRDVDLFWLSTAKRLTAEEARKALAEYRATGGMTDVVMAQPDPSDLSAEHCEALSAAGLSVEEIDWSGFEVAQ